MKGGQGAAATVVLLLSACRAYGALRGVYVNSTTSFVTIGGVTIDIPGIDSGHTDDDTSSSESSSASRASGTPSVDVGKLDQHAGEYPACSIQRQWDRSGALCVAGQAWLAYVRTFPPSPSDSAFPKTPKDPDGNLPMQFADIRPLPGAVKDTLVAEEKPTYYWYIRLVMNFYSILADLADGRDRSLGLPDGWGNQRYYSVREGDTPLIASYTKDDHMVVLVRGTEYKQEWVKDFDYCWAGEAREKEANYTFPGEVHRGFFRVFEKVAPGISDEVNARNPARITIAGHSLGGAVASLLAYHLSTTETSRNVSVMSFGAPSVGNADFAAAFNQNVNNRHLTYWGPGRDGDAYYIGDFISQVPCGKISTCSLDTLTGSEPGEEFEYSPLGGVVTFDYTELRHSETWKRKSDVNSFLYYAPVANHVCSYMCWSAQSVDDRDDLCGFDGLFGIRKSDNHCTFSY